jgi:hypothetical protein
MKITKENMEHVQEILDKYDVSGLNDLDQRLFEWNEANLRVYEVTIPKTVKFKIRVNATSTHAAIDVANDILDLDRTGPNAEHGTYEIVGPMDDAGIITSAVEVSDA